MKGLICTISKATANLRPYDLFKIMSQEAQVSWPPYVGGLAQESIYSRLLSAPLLLIAT